MFEICPAGTFPLSMDPRFELDAEKDLDHLSRSVREATQPFKVLGLILTGSVARGEGTLVASDEGGSRWLGDLDCLLIENSSGHQSSRKLERLLRSLEADLNAHFKERRRGLKIGLTRMAASQVARLRPSIFNRELLEHGKLLWGIPSALSAPRWWTQGKRDVPERDALRLLNNRIIQQIAARMRLENGEAPPLSSEYAIAKFWIELSTSLSVFLGCYRTSYGERQSAIELTLPTQSGGLGRTLSELLVTRLRESMQVKFGQTPKIFSDPRHHFREIASVASRVWYWETARLLKGDPMDFDWRLVINRLRQLDTTAQRLRDWLRLAVRDRGLRWSATYAMRTLKASLLAGSFANAIYASGCLLEFFWDQIDTANNPGPQIAATLRSFFEIENNTAKGQRLALTQAALTAWDHHLRFSPA